MNEAQLQLDVAKRTLARVEARTNGELKRLEDENASHLTRMAAYEMARAMSSEAAQAAEEAVAKGGREAAADELTRSRDLQAQSMKMAMELQSTFEALVPYFVYRTVLEQELEDQRQVVADAQAECKASRRRYHQAMDALEALSLDIQQAEAAQAEARGAESSVGDGVAPAS